MNSQSGHYSKRDAILIRRNPRLARIRWGANLDPAVLPARNQPEPNVWRLPPRPVNGNGEPKLRDQLCLLIRQHRLDASQVKQYAAEFCGSADLRQASREQIQSFITHLAELAVKDRDGLLCKLNSYGRKPEAGAA